MLAAPPGTCRPLIAAGWRVPAVAVIVAAAGAFVSTALWVHGRRGSTDLDVHATRWLRHNVGPDGRDLLRSLTEPALIIGCVILVAAVAAWLRRWTILALAATAPLATVLLIEYVLKPIIRRRLVYSTYDYSGWAFPSGHEGSLTALAVVLVVVLGRVAARYPLAVGTGLLALVLWAAGGALGLTVNGYHYLTDTLGGIFLAVVVVLSAALTIDLVSDRLSSRAGRDRPRTARAA